MKKVLIVDDSIAVSRQLEKIVSSGAEFEVVAQGRNGAEAIKLCQQHKPDILCMDINMPVMDGLTALRALMQLMPTIAVIMVTSLGGVGDKYTEAIRLGAKDVISKPFDKDIVLEMLRRI
jgi:two-component system chemotaxis response regulator CheY